MTKYERNAIICGALFSCVGLTVALITGAGHYFARSGAAVSVVAVVFASRDLRGRLAAAPVLFDRELLASREKVVQLGTDRGLDDAKAAELFEHVFSEGRKEANEIVKRAGKRLLTVELALFIGGTIIWGFGDLPIDLLLARCI